MVSLIARLSLLEFAWLTDICASADFCLFSFFFFIRRPPAVCPEHTLPPFASLFYYVHPLLPTNSSLSLALAVVGNSILVPIAPHVNDHPSSSRLGQFIGEPSFLFLIISEDRSKH